MIGYIMAGGKGERVREYTARYNCQKHEIPIHGRPFWHYIEDWLLSSAVVHSVEWMNDPDVGTGGAIRAKLLYRDYVPTYVLVYGDTFTPFDIDDAYSMFLLHDCDMVIPTREVEDPDYGLVTRDLASRLEPASLDTPDCYMVSSYRRNHEEDNYHTNIGIYMIGPRAHEYIMNQPEGTISLEHDVLNDLIQVTRVASYDTSGYPLYDVGTPSRIERTKNLMEVTMIGSNKNGEEI